ncbi:MULTISPECIES: hypothetical protein [unclassified Sphingomonas]|uniref:hypothetical protein n=1 Tax=unclassified Sphingomonas TaxID=196159 RepID=UPI000B1599CC|nr:MULTISPECIES: hypothetical protein [unclassified Sphingomonas]
MGGKSLTGGAAAPDQGGETDWKAAALDLKDKIDGLGQLLSDKGFDRPADLTILAFAGETIVLLVGDRDRDQSELAKASAALVALGYPVNGGPEDATDIDKLVLALKGVSDDRAAMRIELDQIDALIETAGFDPGKLDEGVNGAAALAVIIGTLTDRAKTLEDQLGKATAKIETLETKGVSTAKAKGAPKKRAIVLELPAAPVPALEAALTGATAIVFSEGGGMIEDIRPIEFEPAAYRASNGKALLGRKIAIDPQIGFARIDCAWLLVDGKPVSCCEVPGGIVAGGGRGASFAADSLIFA